MFEPLTALGQTAPQSHSFGPFEITERFDVALASLAVRRGQEEAVAQAAKAAGIVLPGPAQSVQGAPYGAFWVTPEMWFVEAPIASHEDIVAHLKPAFGPSASLTEQTDAWVRFDVRSAQNATLFERLTNLNLRPAPDGYASRTVIEHLGVYLIKRSESEVTLYGPRSSAESLLHALSVAAKSIL